MPAKIETLASKLLSLPESDRAFLAHKLIQSLDEKGDERAAAEWDTEIERRVEEIEQGKVKCRSSDEVVRELRARPK